MFGIVKENKFVLIDEDKEKVRVTALLLAEEEFYVDEIEDENGNIIQSEKKTRYIPIFTEETVNSAIQEYTEEEITLGADNCYYLKGFAPLEDLREAKRQEINTARDNAEQGGFEYLGKVFDSDPVSCQRIALSSQTAMMCKTAGQEFNVVWTCQDNTTIELDADAMIGASAALTQWSNECHVKASELKEQLAQATTEDEIKNISWE